MGRVCSSLLAFLIFSSDFCFFWGYVFWGGVHFWVLCQAPFLCCLITHFQEGSSTPLLDTSEPQGPEQRCPQVLLPGTHSFLLWTQLCFPFRSVFSREESHLAFSPSAPLNQFSSLVLIPSQGSFIHLPGTDLDFFTSRCSLPSQGHTSTGLHPAWSSSWSPGFGLSVPRVSECQEEPPGSMLSQGQAFRSWTCLSGVATALLHGSESAEGFSFCLKSA